MSCEYINQPQKCQRHSKGTRSHYRSCLAVRDIIDRAKYLIKNVKHKNLVRYVGLNVYYCRYPILKIQIAQEFIDGESIRSIRENGKKINVSAIGEEVLESIIYMQNKPTEVTHGYLNDKSIFRDKNGRYRVADYGIFKYLMYLKGTDRLNNVSDVNALGNLIAYLGDTSLESTSDFINQCQSGRLFQYSDLFNHKFLSK